ncbi:hypothetical protein ACN47E_002557 [Coniothyrium glycines]
MTCPGRLVRERLDPIVNPGAVSSHVHQIAGGGGFNATMSYEDARAAKCSSCMIKEDMSNYWTPELYVKHKDGIFEPVPVVGDGNDVNGGMTVYYLQRRGDDPNELLHAFPKDFRMLAGDPFKRSLDSDLAFKAISFNCLGSENPESNSIPPYNCPGGLRAQVFFPACWDGINVDSSDHKSHMSYPSGGEYNTGPCPSSHPVHLISLFYEVHYDTNRYLSDWTGTQHPFVFANGDATGYGFHGDFLNGWDIAVLQRAIDLCGDGIARPEECPAVTMFTREQSSACKLPASVTENVKGRLAKLPGCNPVTYGPDRAVRQQCDDTATLGAFDTRSVDLTQLLRWEYLGCGSDAVAARALPFSTMSEQMTVETCVETCADKGYRYAGLEYARECFCGDVIEDRYKPKQGVFGSCSMECAGNAGQICGGPNAISLYGKCEEGEECKNV